MLLSVLLLSQLWACDQTPIAWQAVTEPSVAAVLADSASHHLSGTPEPKVLAAVTVRQNQPDGQWQVSAQVDSASNPFDVRAYVVFTHLASGQSVTTGMFYTGDDQWAWRFTGSLPGQWTFKSHSRVADLHGWSGAVRVSADVKGLGFIENTEGYWSRSAGQAFVPSLVMYGSPAYVRDHGERLESDLALYLEHHGFNGLHVPVLCRWFDVDETECDDVDEPNPDLHTFTALEQLIEAAYARGGMVHLWLWGDSERKQNPEFLQREGGLGGVADQRLHRYIAARLGPLPGWTLGYGFDLWEWVTAEELQAWQHKLADELGWPHLLGARGPKNQLSEIYAGLDYVGFEQHRPWLPGLRAARQYDSTRPIMSEDRFRFRGAEQRTKDYTPEEMLLGIWQSALAGGVGAIWGNLVARPGGGRSRAIANGEAPSAPLPNAAAMRFAHLYIENHWSPPVQFCDAEQSAYGCILLPTSGLQLRLYERCDALELPAGTVGQTVRVIDIHRPENPFWQGKLGTTPQVLSLSGTSDWLVEITEPAKSEPVPTDSENGSTVQAAAPGVGR
ncbi:MAG: DUF5060 domain-containing protein [Pseudomonadales bacterium]